MNDWIKTCMNVIGWLAAIGVALLVSAAVYFGWLAYQISTAGH